MLAEAPKLNQEILAYMSGAAKCRDRHFASAQNALGSALMTVAKSISLILELEEGDISSRLTQLLGNAGKLLAGLYYQQSVMRRAFILPGIDEKYRELLKKSDITEDLFGEDLFKRLKHTKSLDKMVEELASRQNKKPLPAGETETACRRDPRASRSRQGKETLKNPCATRIAKGILNGTSMRLQDRHVQTIRLARGEKGSRPVKILHPRMEINNKR